MSEPLVCAVCLTKDRPAMLQRAIRCFRSQTYENKRLVVVNDGRPLHGIDGAQEIWLLLEHKPLGTIGALRNFANSAAIQECDEHVDIFMHYDDDDWSAPTRMAEQVAALQSGEYDATGYSDMLFWEERVPSYGVPGWQEIGGHAWLYTAPHQKRDSVLGTSLAYWRETWERKPFKDTSRGEDFHFYSGLRVKQLPCVLQNMGTATTQMAASIHGGNECSQIIPGHEQWRRVPDWDERLKAIMEL